MTRATLQKINPGPQQKRLSNAVKEKGIPFTTTYSTTQSKKCQGFEGNNWKIRICQDTVTGQE